MNEKCSLSNLSRYLQVIGFLSLIIILIIVVYYYLQSNHSTILEKYEGYSRRDCVVYLKGDIADTEKCDATQGTSNYTDTCSYRFDGWSEFATYTDKDGKTIPYPKKIYTLTNTNSGSFTNPMFTNNCFKPNTSEEDGIPQEFEYNANNVVRYDEQGTSGNTAVGTNIFGGSRYSSMQFLNTANPTDNYNTLLDSICSASTKALGSLKDSVFYMFEFDGTTNKLANITSVALNDDQTTFSISSKYNVLSDLPPIITPLKDAYGIQYDTNAKSLKIFKKNNIEKEVLVYKFNYMSYVCPQSQIKNYMRARRMITPDKFIKYGAATTPNYSKIVSVGNTDINTDWNWSNYSSADFNQDFSVKLKNDLLTAITSRRTAIDRLFDNDVETAENNYNNAVTNYNAANTNSRIFSTNYPTFSSLIGMQKQNSPTITKMFNYISGYNVTNVNNFSLPTGGDLKDIDNSTDKYMIFNFTTYSTGGIGQTIYNINVPRNYTADILVIGGGGGGGRRHGAGGGAGTLLYHKNITLNGTYTIKVGEGGLGCASTPLSGKLIPGLDGANSQFIKSDGSQEYFAFGGGRGTTGGDYLANKNGGQGFLYNANITLPSNKFNDEVVFVSNKQYVNTLTSPEGCRGNIGGIQITNFKGGGGGGAGSAGMNHDAEATINDGYGGLGLAVDITGSAVVYAGGGNGSDFNGSVSQVFNPSFPTINMRGGGGYGSDTEAAQNGLDGTGGGGGGQGNDTAIGGRGGHGVVIIRFKFTNSFSNYSFGELTTDNTPLIDNKISTTLTLSRQTIQENILSSFIFLQKGKYRFRVDLVDLSGQNYFNNILSAELIIYDTNFNNNKIVIKNAIIGYKYSYNKASYFDIDIQNGKFYKLAFRYIYFNLSNYNINNVSFKIYCDNQRLDLSNYLFGGARINNDYINTNPNIMSLFSNVKYRDNSNANYTTINNTGIITYLNDQDFFNIKKYDDEVKRTFEYKMSILPAIIEKFKTDDSNIIYINSIIATIDRLKGGNNTINYNSHLPTSIRSIYNDATIIDIFGKNYERLVTKERVSNYSEISNTTTIRPKKIYVEAVA
jgi:hypothetical protein